jgi:hypothetical protein
VYGACLAAPLQRSLQRCKHTDAARLLAQLRDANDELWAATCSPSEFQSGAYHVRRRQSSLGASARDAAACAKLWDVLSAQAGVDSAFGAAA